MTKALFVNFRIEQEDFATVKNVLLVTETECRDEALIHGAFQDYFGGGNTRTIQPADLYYSADKSYSVNIMDWSEVPAEDFETLSRYLAPFRQEPVEFAECVHCGSWYSGETCGCRER
ncbi:MAG: hypothetical protein HPY50_13595 [Firmicutes bacterium]|nr:hypothetical protein [Bacillota bacterium]